jgi:hypothetical protein
MLKQEILSLYVAITIFIKLVIKLDAMTKNYQVTFLKIYFFFCYCIQFKQILLFVNLMADTIFYLTQ